MRHRLPQPACRDHRQGDAERGQDLRDQEWLQHITLTRRLPRADLHLRRRPQLPGLLPVQHHQSAQRGRLRRRPARAGVAAPGGTQGLRVPPLRGGVRAGQLPGEGAGDWTRRVAAAQVLPHSRYSRGSRVRRRPARPGDAGVGQQRGRDGEGPPDRKFARWPQLRRRHAQAQVHHPRQRRAGVRDLLQHRQLPAAGEAGDRRRGLQFGHRAARDQRAAPAHAGDRLWLLLQRLRPLARPCAPAVGVIRSPAGADDAAHRKRQHVRTRRHLRTGAVLHHRRCAHEACLTTRLHHAEHAVFGLPRVP